MIKAVNHYLFCTLSSIIQITGVHFQIIFRDCNHWSSVTRARDSKSSYAYAPSHQTPRAFINRIFGETVYFTVYFKNS